MATLLQITDDDNLTPGQGLFVRFRLGLLYRLTDENKRLAKVAPAEARLGQALELGVHLRLGSVAEPRLDLGQRRRRVIVGDQREAVAGAELAKRGLHLGLGLLPQIAALHAGAAVEQHGDPLPVSPRRIGGIVHRDERPRKNEGQQQQRETAQQQQQQVRRPPLAIHRRLGLVEKHQAAERLFVFRPIVQQMQDDRDGEAKRAQQIKRRQKTHAALLPFERRCRTTARAGRSSRKRCNTRSSGSAVVTRKPGMPCALNIASSAALCALYFC